MSTSIAWSTAPDHRSLPHEPASLAVTLNEIPRVSIWSNVVIEVTFGNEIIVYRCNVSNSAELDCVRYASELSSVKLSVNEAVRNSVVYGINQASNGATKNK